MDRLDITQFNNAWIDSTWTDDEGVRKFVILDFTPSGHVLYAQVFEQPTGSMVMCEPMDVWKATKMLVSL